LSPVAAQAQDKRDPSYRLRVWLALARRAAVSQQDIARAAGVTPAFVSAVVAGKRPPSARIVEACRQLGMPVSDIFGDELADLDPKENP
jgi:transcriptional regulator with XRE-family HTH domain